MSKPSNNLLAITLSAAVPLRIAALHEKGGPTEEEYQSAREFSSHLGERGDILLFGGGKPDEAAQLFNGLSKAIAILSFCPGGIQLFGGHWCSKGPPLSYSCSGTCACMEVPK